MSRRNRHRVSSEERRARAGSALRKLCKVVLVLLTTALVGTGLVWAGLAGRDWLMTSPTFALDTFEFVGLDHATESELLELAELRAGDNIFELDLVQAEGAMARHPWVRRAVIDRSYPRKLKLKIYEHVPVAIAELGGLYFVDGEGRVFKKLTPGESIDLPILSGVSRDSFNAGGDEIETLFREGLSALTEYRLAGLDTRESISQVALEPDEGPTLFCGKEAFAVKLGFGDYAEKLNRLDTIFTQLEKRGERPEVIRLDNRARPDWVPVQVARPRPTEARK